MSDCSLSKQPPGHAEEPAGDNRRDHPNIEPEYSNSGYYNETEGEHVDAHPNRAARTRDKRKTRQD